MTHDALAVDTGRSGPLRRMDRVGRFQGRVGVTSKSERWRKMQTTEVNIRTRGPDAMAQ